ncbi:MAG: integrase arm-type DNA-binding domain-containing protein [Sideroxydans sp.]|nr:integrase arm-type DNA-binding domain-containing protein [Sideroxydans sp.]
METNKLTPSKISRFKAKPKQYKVSDGGGLYLLVKPNGKQYWHLAYRKEGKHQIASFGKYPQVSIDAARAKRDEFKQKLTSKASVRSKPLREVFDSFVSKRKATATEKTRADTIARCSPIIEELGDRNIAEIRAFDVLPLLHEIEGRSIEVAHRAGADISACFDFAVASGFMEFNPCARITKSLSTFRTSNRKAILTREGLLEYYEKIIGADSGEIVNRYLIILPFIFSRPGELRKAKWTELSNHIWSHKMPKLRGLPEDLQNVIVPLHAFVEFQFECMRKHTGHLDYIFAMTPKPKPFSDGTAMKIIRVAGLREKTSLHGFRATARTLLDEEFDYAQHLIEHQLGHVVKDSNGNAYNRTKHIKQRTEMMNAWGDFLLGILREAGNKEALDFVSPPRDNV